MNCHSSGDKFGRWGTLVLLGNLCCLSALCNDEELGTYQPEEECNCCKWKAQEASRQARKWAMIYSLCVCSCSLAWGLGTTTAYHPGDPLPSIQEFQCRGGFAVKGPCTMAVIDSFCRKPTLVLHDIRWKFQLAGPMVHCVTVLVVVNGSRNACRHQKEVASEVDHWLQSSSSLIALESTNTLCVCTYRLHTHASIQMERFCHLSALMDILDLLL